MRARRRKRSVKEACVTILAGMQTHSGCARRKERRPALGFGRFFRLLAFCSGSSSDLLQFVVSRLPCSSDCSGRFWSITSSFRSDLLEFVVLWLPGCPDDCINRVLLRRLGCAFAYVLQFIMFGFPGRADDCWRCLRLGVAGHRSNVRSANRCVIGTDRSRPLHLSGLSWSRCSCGSIL